MSANDMRFDADVRLEVWVTADEIRDHPGFEGAVESGFPDAERITALRALALIVAQERISGINCLGLGVEITAELSISHVNIERIDWPALAKTKAQKKAEEAAEEAEFERMLKTARAADVHSLPLGQPKDI